MKTAKTLFFGILLIGLLAGCNNGATPTEEKPNTNAPTTASTAVTELESSSSSEPEVWDPTTFPVKLVQDYFYENLEMEVNIPEFSLQNGSTFRITDSFMGGPMIEGSGDETVSNALIAAFKQAGWVTASKSSDMLTINYLGTSGAYSLIMLNRLSFSFEFYVDDAPEEPYVEPEATPFPNDQIMGIVFTPAEVEVVLPALSSPNATFSVANVRPGQTATVIIKNATDTELTAFEKAYQDSNWVKINDEVGYNYGGNSKAYLKIGKMGSMTTYVFSVADAPEAK